MGINNKEAESFYRAIVESSDDAIITKTLDGVITSWNTGAEKIYGYNSKEVLGRSIQILQPEEKPDDIFNIMNTLRAGKAIDHYETLRKTKDGTIISISLTISPIKNQAGQLIGASAIGRDITERVRFREQLRLANEQIRLAYDRLNLALDAAHLGSWDLNLKSKQLACNPQFEKILSLPTTDVHDFDSFLNRVNKQDRDRVEEELKAALDGGPEFSSEFRIDSEEGIRWIAARGRFIYNEQQTAHRMIGILFDITQDKHVQELISSQLNEKEFLLREIHHRIKNNLQVIASLLSLQSAQAPIEIRRALQEAQNRILSIALIHEKLYSTENLAAIDFKEYIKDLVKILHSTFAHGTNHIRVSVECSGIDVDIDKAVPCGLILNELLSNSFKHAFPGNGRGNVKINVSAPNKKVQMVVEDDGVGIKDDIDISNSQGTLGLKLVNLLVNQLHGTIKLDRSTGTRFEISF
jgi:PAS domain S-box-containing protein